MSDIEMICERNHERRKWAEEYEYTDCDSSVSEADSSPYAGESVRRRNDRKRWGVLRTVCTACTMATGGAAAFVGMGLCMGDLMTVVVGSLVAATFLVCGTSLEEAVYREGRRANG